MSTPRNGPRSTIRERIAGDSCKCLATRLEWISPWLLGTGVPLFPECNERLPCPSYRTSPWTALHRVSPFQHAADESPDVNPRPVLRTPSFFFAVPEVLEQRQGLSR
ncbi:hypothetical protein LX36DRAFT_145278 [Colletotrichum falcatum]|nr:hypothetical protein LX36DRAFT_145278 [Colletotrichum falcatum]